MPKFVDDRAFNLWMRTTDKAIAYQKRLLSGELEMNELNLSCLESLHDAVKAAKEAFDAAVHAAPEYESFAKFQDIVGPPLAGGTNGL